MFKERMLENGIYSASNLIILTTVVDLFFRFIMTNVPMFGLILNKLYASTMGGTIMKTILTLLSYYVVIT